jgi:prolyl oligopeptidase
MGPKVSVLAVAAVLACTTLGQAAIPSPPQAKRIPVTDTYFGTTVIDPYRWMESGGADLQAFLKAHNDRTRAVLDSIPGRAGLAARLLALSETSNVSYDVVSRHGAYFYEKLPPGANSMKLYVRSGIGGAERVLVDPDALPGPRQAISFFNVSNDGARVAYGLSPAVRRTRSCASSRSRPGRRCPTAPTAPTSASRRGPTTASRSTT